MKIEHLQRIVQTDRSNSGEKKRNVQKEIKKKNERLVRNLKLFVKAV